MSGDRLAQIEAAVEITLRRARDSAGSQPEFVVAPDSVSCADVLALVEIAKAAREIRDKAKWYADNDARLPHEVDHALCVEVYALADNALARLDGAA